MKIAAMTFRLRAPWVHSLKEKRMIVKSLIAKLQNRFHVSTAEIDEQDIHQIIVIIHKKSAQLVAVLLTKASCRWNAYKLGFFFACRNAELSGCSMRIGIEEHHCLSKMFSIIPYDPLFYRGCIIWSVTQTLRQTQDKR